jgi:hypothetical protein
VKPSLIIPVALGLTAFALAFLLPVGRSFSDTLYLVGRVESCASPYYNVAYVPLGRLSCWLFGGWLGTEGALDLLSALSVGGGVAVAAHLAERLGAGRLGTTLAGLLMAFAPGVLFFGGVIEVHAVQLFGASLAVLLAWRAHRSPTRSAWVLLTLAVLVAMVTHVSNLLLLPGLVALAWRVSPDAPIGFRITRRGLPLLAGLVGVVAIGGLALASADFATWSVHPALQWLGTLIVFGQTFLSGLVQRGFFSASEALAYLDHELVAPLGLLALGLVGGLFVALGRQDGEARTFARRALFAILPALIVLPQGGVLERGGYFMSYAPLLAVLVGVTVARLAGAERRALFFASILIGAQLVLALEARSTFRAMAPEARLWARAASHLMQPGDSALVAGLSRNFALAAAAPECHVRDLARDLDLVPEARRTDELKRVLADRLGASAYPGDLWLDADLLPGLTADGLAGLQSESDFPLAWRARLFFFLTEVSPVPVSFEVLDLGAPDQPGLAGFDVARAPALIRVHRRPADTGH